MQIIPPVSISHSLLAPGLISKTLSHDTGNKELLREGGHGLAWGWGIFFFALRCGLLELMRPRQHLVERRLPGQRGKLDGWSGN